jgi:hypothetical protein
MLKSLLLLNYIVFIALIFSGAFSLYLAFRLIKDKISVRDLLAGRQG